MKILAIRLRNLASLAGPVVLDFTTEPLASAGLFAITGPTGAGKSTLLDALCLALFGAVPRLGATARDAKVPDADGEIAIWDARNLLRRGAGAGFAEVDFLGVDGVRYRARWEANRARDKAGAKLQPSRQSLLDLDSDRLLATQKNEYRPLLEARLGLNFEQFTRAVLLAQSEFSAFLKANDNERSELLEKLTDTALYSRLGRRAYDKARSARQQLENLQAQDGAIQALDEHSRRDLDERLVMARITLSGFQEERRMLQVQRQHQSETELLLAQAHAATEAVAQAQHQWQQQEGERQTLALLQALAPQRAVLEQSRRLGVHHQKLAEARNEALTARAAAEQASEAEQGKAAEAMACLQRATEAQAEAAPALRQAQDLQATLQLLEQELAPRQTQWAQVERDFEARRTALTALEQAQAKGDTVLHAVQARLEASAGLARLASAWAAFQPRLRQAVEAAQRVSELQAKASPLKQEAERAGRVQGDLQARLHELAARLGGTEDLGERLKLLTDLLRDNRDGLHALTSLDEHWRRCAQAQERLADLAAQQQDLARKRQTCIEQGQAAKAEHERASQALDVTTQVLERQHLARLRAGLLPGAPCPVCGSEDHPGETATSAEVALQTLEAQDLAEIETAQARVNTLAEQLAELRAEVRGLIDRLKALHEQQQREQAQLTAARDALGTLARQDELLAIPEPRRQAWLNDAVARLREQISRDEEQLQALLAAQAEATQLQQQLRQAQQRSDEAAAQWREHQASLERERQRFEDELDGFGSLLPAATLAALRAEPVQARETLERTLAERLSLEEQHQAQSLSQSQRAQHIQVAQAQLVLLGDQAREQRIAVDQAQKRLEALRKTLAEQLAPHASVTAWQAQLDTAVTQARDAQAQANQALQLARDQALQAQAQARSLEEQLTANEAECAELTLRLASWRAGHPTLDDSTLAHLLTLGEADIEVMQARLGQAQRSLEQAQAVLAERQARVQAHQGQAPTASRPAEDLAAALVEIESTCQLQEQQCAELRAAQLEDDQRRQARDALAAQLAHAQAEHTRWARLSALIGSAEGDRLRKIAQAYNLDLLVRHANAQLLQLARRYRLKRGGSALGLLVVDTEMGDEVRSVHSLSGGETFLVSLALALGLASMASSSLKIESLFIDEGFGSLDPESLQLAMDALDNLQAQGRKVAVISHVQEMHERIPVQIQVQRQGNGLSEVRVVP